LFLIWWWQ